jgi:diguanylate cyclase (GGDEF)-like protein
VVARYGGEEFVVLLPATSEHEAIDVAERLRSAIADGAWPRRAVTASLGIGTIGPRTAGPSTLVEQADRALYHSKQAGRNQVTHYRTCEPIAEPVETSLG